MKNKRITKIILMIATILLLFSVTMEAKENSCEEWRKLERKRITIDRELFKIEDGYLKSFKVWQKEFLTNYFNAHKKEVSDCRTSFLFQKIK